MKPILTMMLLAAPFAAAQSATDLPESGCGHAVDLIIQACLNLEQPLSKLCGPNDWNCLCTQATNVRTCYNNCPADPRAVGAMGTEQSYCAAAKTYPSSTSKLDERSWSNGTPTTTATPTPGSTVASGAGSMSTGKAWPTNGTMANASLSAVEAVMGGADRFGPSVGAVMAVLALALAAL